MLDQVIQAKGWTIRRSDMSIVLADLVEELQVVSLIGQCAHFARKTR